MANIDNLKKEVDSIQTSLDRLKNNISILTDEDKEKRTKDLKNRAEFTKTKIQAEITMLSLQLGEDKKREKAEAEVLLNTINEIINLQLSVLTENNNRPTEANTGAGNEGKAEKGGEKLSFWDTGRGKTLKGIGIVGGALSGIAWLNSKLKGNKNEEETSEDDTDENTGSKKKKKKNENNESNVEGSRRSNFLLKAGLATGAVVGGIEAFKHWNRISSRFKERLGLALSFDESIQKVESEVRNGKVDADHFGAFNSHFEGGITYDEGTKEICSYGQRTKIEKNGKKLQGMEVEFASWEELIHAANIVNFAKRRLKGRGETSKPFGKTSWGGDIQFSCSAKGQQEFMSANGSNEWTWILGTLGTTGGGILGGYCAGVKGAAVGAVSGGVGGYALGSFIDNTSTAGRFCKTVSRGKNLDLFINYLNNQTDENGKSLWESYGEQHIDPGETPINPVVDNGLEGTERGGVLAEIEKEYGEDQTGRRNLEIKRGGSEPGGNPEEYMITSYGHELKLILKGGPTKKGENIDYNKITKIHIEKYSRINGKRVENRGDGLDIDFPHSEKGLKEAIRVVNLTNMIVEDRNLKGAEKCPFAYGKYKSPFAFEIDTPGMGTNHLGGTTILNHNTLKSKYPTILDDLEKFPSTQCALSSNESFQRKMWDQAVNDKTTGSQYIKYLHQIGKGNYWKKIG